MAKSLLRKRARALRQQGLGIKTIAQKLHVSSSTVSLWCRDILLSPAQISELERRMHDPFYGRRLAYVQKQQKKRKDKIALLMQQGIKEIGHLKKRELFLSGVSLYWAEGFKKDNLVGFANSDPSMALFFIQWLEMCCNIPKTGLKFRVGVNDSYQNKIKSIELFWAHSLNVSIEQFQKPFFQKAKWKKKYDHPEDYHGVIRIRVAKSTDLLRKIHGWIEGLKKQTPQFLL